MSKTFIHMPKAARFTKSFGEGFQLFFPMTRDVDHDLLDALGNLPSLMVVMNSSSLLSLHPALFNAKKATTLFSTWDNDVQTGWKLSGRNPLMQERFGRKSYADMPVDIRFYDQDAGVLQVSMPTREQLEAADSTEPKGKIGRRRTA